MKVIKVELQTSLKRYTQDGRGQLSVTLEDNATVGDLLEMLGLLQGEVGLMLINGELADDMRRLPPGATVRLYPIFGGG